MPEDAAHKIAVLWNIKMMYPATDCSLQIEESWAAIFIRFQQTLVYMNETCSDAHASGNSCIHFSYVMFWLKRCKGFGKGMMIVPIKVANFRAAFLSIFLIK